MTCLAARNDNLRRYVWSAKSEEILKKIRRAEEMLSPVPII